MPEGKVKSLPAPNSVQPTLAPNALPNRASWPGPVPPKKMGGGPPFTMQPMPYRTGLHHQAALSLQAPWGLTAVPRARARTQGRASAGGSRIPPPPVSPPSADIVGDAANKGKRENSGAVILVLGLRRHSRKLSATTCRLLLNDTRPRRACRRDINLLWWANKISWGLCARK